ncbi:MFS transporter [Nocardia sp. CS682]|uniref:MFS transporter n=1 Tax=Nocardia sp. CS682 TaxID=1047172 RepID=UPI0010754748|nr:MFS transporter [Nocardia sp. CS682]QBS39406.1 MFS transporter [Nocardia sp. CS682]
MTGTVIAPVRRSRLLLAVLLLAMIVAPMAQTAVMPMLPALAGEFGVSASAVSWVMTANLLAAAVGTPLFGRLGDLRGRKLVLILCLSVAAVGALLAALSDSYGLLIAARVLQGAGAGVLPPAISVIRAELPPKRVASGLALVSVSTGVGAAFGILASGVLMVRWNYQSVFWLLLILSLLALVAVVWGLPADRVPGTERGADPWGALTLALWLLALLIAISQGNTWGWTDWVVPGLLCAAMVFVVVWCVVERRVRFPVIDMTLLTMRPVAFGNAAAALSAFGMYGSFIAISSLAQTPRESGFTTTALGAGLMLLPSAAGNLLAGMTGGVLLNRFGSRPTLVLGGILSAAGVALLVIKQNTELDLYLASALFGIGTGFAFTAIRAYINDAVPLDQLGAANGMNVVFRTIGAAAGSAVTGAVLSSDQVLGTHWPTQAAHETAFLIATGTFLATAILPFLILKPRR